MIKKKKPFMSKEICTFSIKNQFTTKRLNFDRAEIDLWIRHEATLPSTNNKRFYFYM